MRHLGVSLASGLANMVFATIHARNWLQLAEHTLRQLACGMSSGYVKNQVLARLGCEKTLTSDDGRVWFRLGHSYRTTQVSFKSAHYFLLFWSERVGHRFKRFSQVLPDTAQLVATTPADLDDTLTLAVILRRQ